MKKTTNPPSDDEQIVAPCSYRKDNNTIECKGCPFHEAGDCPRIWEEKEIINWIETNMGLLNLTYHTFVNPAIVDFNADDIKQEAFISVLKATTKYDPAKGTKFTTYVCKSIQNNLSLLYRKRKAQKRTTADGQSVISLDSPYFTSSEDSEYTDLYSQKMKSLCSEVVLDDPGEELARKDLERLIYRIANEECSKDEILILEILINSLDEGVVYTQDKIAKKIGCSQAKVSTTLNLLRGKLRLALKDYGYYV